MKFVPVRDLRVKPGAVWKKLSAEESLVITSNGQPMALLCKVDKNNLDESLSALRRARALMALERIQRAAVLSGRSRMTTAEIENEIKATRRARQR